MIGRLETLFRRWRRRLNRSEWVIRALGLEVAECAPTERGLLLVQIDGLGRDQVQAALDSGRMPFLRRLIEREGYDLHSLYSGLPSSTPAVQAELFYGPSTAVPAFAFVAPEDGRAVRMSEAEAAERIEAELERNTARPLLRGGSCYTNIFTGGADEPHFCVSALGWGRFLRHLRPVFGLALVLLYFRSLARTGALLVVEAVLAVIDCVRGIIAGHDLLSELSFVPARVGVCILLREVSVIGASLDLTRGLPIVQLNLPGYDEQAHRRGPSSLFAHWTLKGIDDALRRLWHTARHAHRRSYDVWIYSDHGQESAIPFADVHGREVKDAVYDALAHLRRPGPTVLSSAGRGDETGRAALLRGKAAPADPAVHSAHHTIALSGALGVVRLDRDKTGPPSIGTRVRLADALVDRGIPLVLVRGLGGGAIAVTPQGRHALPKAGPALFAGHPFAGEVARDLVALCHHPGAGDAVFSGWRAGAQPVSFCPERGSHGGPGERESHGFALLPPDAPLAPATPPRPRDLRAAALHWLDHGSRPPAAGQTEHLRVMTYNVHGCRGMDGHLSCERIARVIAAARPDIVCLQELDVGRPRSGGIDQAHRIARALEMDMHFHAAMRVEEEQYGNAVLTPWPMRVLRAGRLDGPATAEPRGAIKVEITTGNGPVIVVATHLGLGPQERRRQARALVSDGWLDVPGDRPLILCGDFNTLPGSPIHRLFARRLPDAQRSGPGRPRPTFPGRLPSARIDHVFVDPRLGVTNVTVPRSALAQAASDHLPLVVDLDLAGVHAPAPTPVAAGTKSGAE